MYSPQEKEGAEGNIGYQALPFEAMVLLQKCNLGRMTLDTTRYDIEMFLSSPASRKTFPCGQVDEHADWRAGGPNFAKIEAVVCVIVLVCSWLFLRKSMGPEASASSYSILCF